MGDGRKTTETDIDALVVSEAEIDACWEKPVAVDQKAAVSLSERARRGDREKFRAVMDKVPDVEPEDYDKLD